jgi:hypothetical protein
MYTPCEDSVLFSIGILYLLYLQMSKYGSIFCATKDKDSKLSDHILHRSSNRDERNNSKQLLIYVRVCVFVFNVPQCTVCTNLSWASSTKGPLLDL